MVAGSEHNSHKLVERSYVLCVHTGARHPVSTGPSIDDFSYSSTLLDSARTDSRTSSAIRLAREFWKVWDKVNRAPKALASTRLLKFVGPVTLHSRPRMISANARVSLSFAHSIMTCTIRAMQSSFSLTSSLRCFSSSFDVK
jgi:hypothetical protein